MKKILYTLPILSSLMFANTEYLLKEIQLYKPEISEKEYIKELQNVLKYKDTLYDIDRMSIVKNFKEEKLGLLQELEIKSKSSILDSLILTRYILSIDLKKPTEVKKYIVDIADKLYNKGFCDGFIFKGEYENTLNNKPEKALMIYQEGLNKCKVDWKRFEILGRFNQLDYKLNKHKYK